MHATPNQHLLTLPSSPVGKSSDLHAEVQQFKPNSGHKFFLHTYTHFFAHAHTYTCTRALCVRVYVYVCVCRSIHTHYCMVHLLAPLFRTIFSTQCGRSLKKKRFK